MVAVVCVDQLDLARLAVHGRLFDHPQLLLRHGLHLVCIDLLVH